MLNYDNKCVVLQVSMMLFPGEAAKCLSSWTGLQGFIFQQKQLFSF
ncbi:hypothetical protein SLEP1_g6955 [Rubroshorea leprosula]|uniref:Uncharacterized protein n=1 Tax=Rubroshorea leprosula TaxID=152421 RepID=A0AAV5I7N5_9ROSI|nr:hypothetical protein SLEP1_g6955 [Rubroshorea leprosula]